MGHYNSLTNRQLNHTVLRLVASLLEALVLTSPAVTPDSPKQSEPEATRFEALHRSTRLTPEREIVRQQATAAVEADIDGYLRRCIEAVTTE